MSTTEEAPNEQKPEQTDLFAPHADRIVSKLEELQKSFVPPRKEAPAEQPKQRFTTQQLQQWVDEGKLTTAQMIEALRMQDREDIEANLEQRMNARLASTTAEARLESKAAELVAQFPEFKDRSSDLWKAAAAEFQGLLEDGHEDNSRTRLAAMKMAVKTYQRPEVKETTAARQRSVESPGTSSGRTERKKPESGNGWPSWLPQHVADYYDEAIARGRYNGRNDPMLKKEMEIRERRHKGAA